MVWLQKAKIVDPSDYAMYEWEDWSSFSPSEDDVAIRSVGFSVKVPEVIVLADYNRLPRAGVAFNRKNLFVRDRYVCQYCTKKLVREDLTIDHVVPRAQGGISEWTNCVLACLSCNHRKADRTPKQAGMKLLKEPKKPQWVPTFHNGRILDSWEKFVDEMYWNVSLESK
jgi:5-methylcytosine-specific restriction endonuclease McrA